jgi:hypothetical protein
MDLNTQKIDCTFQLGAICYVDFVTYKAPKKSYDPSNYGTSAVCMGKECRKKTFTLRLSSNIFE